MRNALKGMWKHRDKRGKGILYRNSLIFILLAASIPGLVIGLLVYQFATNQLKNDISQLHYQQLNERIKNIDDQMNYLELGLSNWAFNPTFGFRLQNLDFVYYFQDTWEVTKSLNVMESSHSLIKEVELYIEQDEPKLFKTEFYRIVDKSTVEQYKEILAQPRRMYWQIDAINDPNNIILIHKVPGESAIPFGTLLVRLDKDKLVNLLKTMTPYNEGTTFLLNNKFEVMLSDGSEPQALQAKLIDKIQTLDKAEGQFLLDFGDENYSVSYGKFKRISDEWIYVSAAPTTMVTSPVIRFSKAILWISSLSLLMALLLAFIVSRKVYSPIEKLMNLVDPERRKVGQHKDEFQYISDHWRNIANRSIELQNKMESSLPILRNTFLMQLLQGHIGTLSEDDLKRRMKSLYWEAGNHYYSFIHIYLTGLHRIDQKMTASDERLMTFAAYNMAQELVSAQFRQGYALNFHDLSLGIFIIESKEEPIAAETLNEFCLRYTDAVNQHLRLQVSITMSRKCDELRKVRNLYMEIERAASYRQFLNQNQIIRMDDLPKEFTFDDISYPFELELELLQAMRNGNREQAYDLLKRFTESGGQKKERYVQQNLLQLLGSIQHMMLQSGVNPVKLFHGDNLYTKLSQIRDPNKLLRWMNEVVIIPFLDELENRVHSQQKGLMNQIVTYIHEHYRDDISLEQCADMIGINSYTLSKWFKQATGVNFIDYVTELRIKNAQKLLRSTDMLINDIAQEVGYQQRYFNRIFKKMIGVTPTEYRNNSSENKIIPPHQKSETT